MEKAKRKHSLKIAHRRLSILLLFILALSVFFYFYPIIIIWHHAFSDLTLQTYELLPLISLPLGLWSYRRYGLTKLHWFLIFTCLALAILMSRKLHPCGVDWAYRLDYLGSLPFFRNCDYSFLLF